MRTKITSKTNTKSQAKHPKDSATATPSKLTESMIAESMVVRVGLDQPKEGRMLLLPAEPEYVRESLIAICSAPRDTEIEFYGCNLCYIWPPEGKKRMQGTQILSRSDNPGDLSIKIQLTLAPKDQLAQHIRVTYDLFKNKRWELGEPTYFLECEGTPTTVLAGNNVLPVTTVDPETGEAEKLPSSSRATLATVNRALFDLLNVVSETVRPGREFLAENWTLEAIRRRDFDLVRAQYCCYLPTRDVSQFLQLICLLYAQPVFDAERISTLANHLGLAVKPFIGKNNRVTGIQFQKRQGTKLVASLVFYNKQRRVAQTRQGKTLSAEEKEIVNRDVRFDMTLHRRGIQQIVGAARKVLEERREKLPNFLANEVSSDFLEESTETTVAMFEDAVTVLSSPPVRGIPTRKSFSSWLLKRCLTGILGLGNIVKCTPAKLHAFTELDNPVVKAWCAVESTTKGKGRWPKKGDWTTPIMERTGLGKTHVYEERNRLLAEHGIDISMAYKFYRDLEHLGPKSLITAENREALNRALSKDADKDEVFRLLQEGIDNFFGQLADVVGATVNSPPTKLPLKKVGNTASPSVHATRAEMPSAPSTGGRGGRKGWPGTVKALQLDGIWSGSPSAKLRAARDAALTSLKGTLSNKERDDTKFRLQVLSGWIKRRADRVKRQQATRRRNKAFPPRK